MKKTVLSLTLILLTFNLFSQIKLPKLISDGVIFQRDTDFKIWGWASPNETVEITFKNNSYKTNADVNGDWTLILPKQEAGGPYEMIFKASNEIKVKNILFGDVWVCSGQSNMELTMDRVKEKYNQIIKNSENSKIRQFLVPDNYDFKTESIDLKSGSWTSANPQSILNFSAVAYFFAKEIYEKYHVPIGLINTSLGGSPIEAWMSEDALIKFPDAYNEAQKFKNDELIKQIQLSDKKRSDDWYSELNNKDKGISNTQLLWNQPTTNDDDWEEMEIPGYWSNQSIGNVNGVVWFRKEINVSKSMVGKSAKLSLGRIVDQDYAYINGEFVGTTSYQYPPRKYEVKSGILKEGKNNITVRVINNAGNGGFVLDKPYYLAVENDTIDLKGSWKYKLGATMQPLESQTFIRWKPTGLYNAMISPLLKFSIKGVLWYQGESNTWNPNKYAEMFPLMVKDWRKRWNQGDFPFIYVQLANFMEEKNTPSESNWAAFRQVQLESLSVPNTGMAVIIDLGEWNDIHPLNKEDVGKRLSLQARKIAYGENELYASSPSPKNTKFKQNKVIIKFKNTGSGLVTKKGENLNCFSISNDGKNFVWAKAKIKGNNVIVWNKEIKKPTVVRYAWADNPSKANLFTKDGLPASPFEVKKK
ncbi:sialate O-acetylesterase [Lutibacter sp. B1]|uniref:sialate O-acetylesterase n=1 Tax=Lutibacter sp. B1 TaxID=2725996 RepID=UPI001456F54E|nr:sialate O-acetylesterase [Lutibacter sp. B1]NLP58547.1 sialate O-acetylesterase [Lutibacter sp. B1]